MVLIIHIESHVQSTSILMSFNYSLCMYVECCYSTKHFRVLNTIIGERNETGLDENQRILKLLVHVIKA